MNPEFDLSLLAGDWYDLRAEADAKAGVDAASLAAELAQELPPGHRLDGVQVEAVAVRRRHKDVIFWLPVERRWALVHLTWRSETDPKWPSTAICDDWLHLAAELN